MPTINQLIANPRKPLRVRVTAPALQGSPPEARRLPSRLHDHPEEAELGTSQGRQDPSDQQPRGYISYIPGEGHNLQEHWVVRDRGGRVRHLPRCS